MSEEKKLLGEPQTPDELISLADAAKEFPISHDHLRNLIRWKKLWGKKYGRNWFTTRTAIESYLATDRRPGPKTDN